MINEKKMQFIKVTEQYLLEKYGAAFLRLSKEKQSALICDRRAFAVHRACNHVNKNFA